MADHLISQIQGQLEPGWELRFLKGGQGMGIHQLYKNGRPYLERGIKLITINDSDSHHYRRKQISTLERVGAIKPTIKSRPKVREAERVTNYAVPTKSAVEMARTILKDYKANPRERKMAKAYLDLVARYVRTVKLAERLSKKH